MRRLKHKFLLVCNNLNKNTILDEVLASLKFPPNHENIYNKYYIILLVFLTLPFVKKIGLQSMGMPNYATGRGVGMEEAWFLSWNDRGKGDGFAMKRTWWMNSNRIRLDTLLLERAGPPGY